MKTLKIKVFISIFIILNVFSLSLLFVYNYQNYREEQSRILNILNNNKIFGKRSNELMRFIDNNIYTVVLNDGNIVDIISHSAVSEIDDSLESYINNINKDTSVIHIGNLYKDKYSYKISKNRMIIVDCYNSNQRLSLVLRTTLFLFIIIEIISYLISFYLSRWIIKPAVDAFESQKRFIADASHELKTPLAVIMASADSLSQDKNEEKWISNIQNESERMNNLIKNLLDLSKIESTNTVKENIDISKLVEKSTIVLESLMFEKNITLQYDINEKIYLNCNSDEIKQLVSILLDNAIKHSINNGKIIVNLYKNKNNIILEVKNKGKSIEKGEEEKIFERFYRVDESRNRNDNRYGLGLAIAKSIVEKNNGNISAHSSNGYTTFKVVFKNK